MGIGGEGVRLLLFLNLAQSQSDVLPLENDSHNYAAHDMRNMAKLLHNL